MLLEQVNEEQMTSPPTKRSKHASTIWKTNNQFLVYRSRELSKIKLDSIFKPRTAMMVDAANFSDFLGNIDRVMLECPLEVLNFPEESISSHYECHVSRKHNLIKVFLKNGEICILKQLLKSNKYSKTKCLTLIAREMKILSLVGPHSNIVNIHGVTWFKNEPSLVMSFESDITLKYMLQKFRSRPQIHFIKAIVNGITAAISFLQEKKVVHNMLIPENICLRYNGKVYDPVIVGFSYAIRLASSRILTIPQQKLVEDFVHMPYNVRKGKEAPSFSSDMYAFACVLRKLSCHLPNGKSHLISGTMIETLIRVRFSPEYLKEYVSHCLAD